MSTGRGLKYGVIGTGSMGRHHARIIYTLPGVDLVGVADLDEARAKEVAAAYRALPFTDYQEMLSEVSALSIASPTETHYEVAQACLNAGKHILVEKPLAKTAEQGELLVNLAREKGVVLAVGLIERFNPAYQELHKIMRQERRILGINIVRQSPFPERITDANVIQDMMVHDLDLLLNLIPTDEIEEIKGEGKKVKTKMLDLARASIYFKSGVIAKVEANRTAEDKARKFIVSTEGGMIEADLLNKTVYYRDFVTHIPSTHFTKSSDQLTDELLNFIKAIKTSTAPRVTGEDGLRALKLAEEVEKACS